MTPRSLTKRHVGEPRKDTRENVKETCSSVWECHVDLPHLSTWLYTSLPSGCPLCGTWCQRGLCHVECKHVLGRSLNGVDGSPHHLPAWIWTRGSTHHVMFLWRVTEQKGFMIKVFPSQKRKSVLGHLYSFCHGKINLTFCFLWTEIHHKFVTELPLWRI